MRKNYILLGTFIPKIHKPFVIVAKNALVKAKRYGDSGSFFSRIEAARTAEYCRYDPESPSKEIEETESKTISLPIDCRKTVYFRAPIAIISEISSNSSGLNPRSTIFSLTMFFMSASRDSAVTTLPVREDILPCEKRIMPCPTWIDLEPIFLSIRQRAFIRTLK